MKTSEYFGKNQISDIEEKLKIKGIMARISKLLNIPFSEAKEIFFLSNPGELDFIWEKESWRNLKNGI